MKKILLACLLIIALSFSLASCATSGGPTTGNGGNTSTEKVRYEVPANGYDGSEVTITFSHTMNEQLRGVLDDYIKEFNKLYPNITVEHAQIGGYPELRDQIKTELTAGNQPNIAYCYPDHVALYNITKKVVPLDNFIESTIPVVDALGNETVLGYTQEQLDDFVSVYYSEGTVFDAAGTMYTLPFSKSTEVLYYNVEFFEQEGLEVPTTWEKMEEVCEYIKNKYPDIIPLGYDSEDNWFITMCEQYDSPYTSGERGKYFLFNNDTNKSFVEMFREWYQAGYVTTKALYGGYTSALFTETTKAERAVMCIGSTGGAKNQVPDAVDGAQPFTVGIAPIPQVSQDNAKAISQGPSLCIFDSDNKQEVVASWLFVKFLTTCQELQAEVSMLQGYMPVIQSVKEVDFYKTFLDNAGGDTVTHVTALAVKTGLSLTDTYFVSPAFNGSSEARDQVGSLMQYCFVTSLKEGQTVKQLLDEAFQNAIKECIANS